MRYDNAPGRYVMLRAFSDGKMLRHYESDNPGYIVVCAKSLLAASARNKVTAVQVIDTKMQSVLWETRA